MKKQLNYYRIISLLLALVLVLLVAKDSAFAADIAPGTAQELELVHSSTESAYDVNYYYATENGIKFPVYCFNSTLHWPYDSHWQGSKEFVPDPMMHLSDDVKDKLYRIFYAGYPHNNLGLYEGDGTQSYEIVYDFDGFNFTEEAVMNAHTATQYAIWIVLNENNVPNNTDLSRMKIGLIKDLVDFANGEGEYGNVNIPERGTTISDMETYRDQVFNSSIILKADGTPLGDDPINFEQDENGKFVSEELHFADSAYELPYKIELKSNNSLVSEATTYGNTPFVLTADEKPEEAKVTVETDNYWPSDVYQYIRKSEANTSERAYQDMSGCYFMSVPLKMDLNVQFNEKTRVTIEKEWDDDNNKNGLRPDNLTFNVKTPSGELVDTIVLSSGGNGWDDSELIGSSKLLPKYDSEGKLIEYSVEEAEVPNYTVEQHGYVFVNKHIPTNPEQPEQPVETIKVSVTKTWDDEDDKDGLRPTEIQIKVLRQSDGVEVGVIALSAGADGVWQADELTGSLDELERYDDQGNEIKYTLEENPVDEYSPLIVKSPIDPETPTIHDYTVINKHTPKEERPSTTIVTVRKAWDDGGDKDGIRPTEVEFRVMHGDVEIDTITLSAGDDNVWDREDLEGQSRELLEHDQHGNRINYTVKEKSVYGYTSDKDEYAVPEDGSEIDIINVHTPEHVNASVTINKIWDDEDNKEGLRPNMIHFFVMNGDEEVGSITLSDGNDDVWDDEDLEGSCYNLPKYDSAGNEIVYTIKEFPVDGYETTIDGFTITNKHETVKPDPDPDKPDKPDTPDKPNKPNKKHNSKKGVLTGDSKEVYVWTIFLVLALSIILVLLKKKSRY